MHWGGGLGAIMSWLLVDNFTSNATRVFNARKTRHVDVIERFEYCREKLNLPLTTGFSSLDIDLSSSQTLSTEIKCPYLANFSVLFGSLSCFGLFKIFQARLWDVFGDHLGIRRIMVPKQEIPPLSSISLCISTVSNSSIFCFLFFFFAFCNIK